MKKVIFALLIALCTAWTDAAPVTMQVTGIVDSVNFGAPWPVTAPSVGSVFKYNFTYDSALAVDSDPSPTSGIYLGAITDVSVAFEAGTYTFPSLTTNQINIISGLSNSLTVSSYNGIAVVFGCNGFDNITASVALDEPIGSFTTDALSALAANIRTPLNGSFSFARNLNFPFTGCLDTSAGATGHITNISVQSAAAPTATISASTLDYGLLAINSDSKSLPVTLTNTGQSAVTGTASVTTPFALTSNVPVNIPVGGTQTFSAFFSPAVPCLCQGTLTLTTNAGVFNVTLKGAAATPPPLLNVPSIQAVAPDPVVPGTLVTITGKNFGFKPGKLNLNTIDVTPQPSAWNNTFVTFTVPPIAAGKYFVTMQTAIGVTTQKIEVLASTPVITDITPRREAVGSSISIKGFNFGAQNIVMVGGVPADINFWSDTLINIKIPTLRTGPQNVIVITKQNGATAAASFRVHDLLLIPTYGNCTVVFVLSGSVCPPLQISARPSDVAPNTYDIIVENLVDRWYLMKISTSSAFIPVSNKNTLSLTPIVGNSFLLAPTSKRIFYGVSFTSPANITFDANADSAIATSAMTVDMLFRIVTGHHMPVTGAEASELILQQLPPLVNLTRNLAIAIHSKDINGVLSTLADLKSLIADPVIGSLVIKALGLNAAQAALWSSDLLGFSFNIYTALLETAIQFNYPSVASATITTH